MTATAIRRTSVLGAVLATVFVFGCGGGDEKGFSLIYQTEHDADWDLTPAIFAISGSGPDEIWAGAQFGTIIHFSDGQVRVVPTPASGSLGSLSVLGPSNAFALDVVRGEMFEWNGREWAARGEGGNRFGIWAESPQSVWAAGEVVERWDGQRWSAISAQPGGFMSEIKAADPENIFIRSYDGYVVRSQGESWVDISPGVDELNGLLVLSPSDIWTTGSSGEVYRWDGSVWTTMATGTQQILVGISGTGPDDVWAGGYLGSLVHWDGAEWSFLTTPNGEDINTVWAPRRGEVWIGDVSGAVFRYRL